MYDLKTGSLLAFDALGLVVPFADPPPALGKPTPAAEHFAFAESPFAELEEPEAEALAWHDLEADEQESAWRDEGGGEGEWLQEDGDEQAEFCPHCRSRTRHEAEEQEEWLQEEGEGSLGQFEHYAVQETTGEREETLLESETWEPNPEQIAFQNRVLALHIERTKSRRGPPLPDLSENQLAIIPGSTVKSKKSTAAAAGKMLAAANAELAAAQASRDPDILKIKRFTANSGYRSSVHQLKLWLGYFPKYYRRTRSVREKFAQGQHSDRACAYMLDPRGFALGGRIAAPGYSNHQNGIAIDLRQELSNGKHIANDSDSASRSIWRKTWFHKWLKVNAATYGFVPLSSEEWHWEYKLVPAASPAAPMPAAVSATPTALPLPDAIVRIANQEFDRWHPPGGADLVETDVAATPILQQYYREYNNDGGEGRIASNLQSRVWQRRPENAWSAVFISWVMRTAGAGTTFRYTRGHWLYIMTARSNRLQNNAASPFWAYRPTEVAPQLGDIVCKSRANSGATYDNVGVNGFQPFAHGDIVTEVRQGSIRVVGGNVNDNVDRRELITLPDGRLSLAGAQGVYFAVVRCRGAADVLPATREVWEEQDSYEGTNERETIAKEAEWTTTSAQSELENQAPRAIPRDYLDGKLWLHNARNGKLKVAVFVPAGARSQQSVDILLYVHGLLSPCGKPKVVPEGLITDGQFQLAQSVRAAARPTVLIVPLFQEDSKRWDAHGLGRPGVLNALIAEMLLEIGRRNGGPAPAIGNLIVAGHSKAYDVLYPLARAHRDPAIATGALARLTGIWALDASYGTFPTPEFKALLKSKPGLTVQAIYRKGSETDKFKGQSLSGRLTLRPLAKAFVCHCAVPGHVLPGLLADLSSQTTTNEDYAFDSDFRDLAGQDDYRDEAFEGEHVADAELNEALERFEGQYEEGEWRDEDEDESYITAEESEEESEHDTELEEYHDSYVTASGLVDDMYEEESFDYETASFTPTDIGRNLDAISLTTQQKNAGLVPNAVALNLIASRNLRGGAKQAKFNALRSALKQQAKAQDELAKTNAARPPRQQAIDRAKQKLTQAEERVEGTAINLKAWVKDHGAGENRRLIEIGKALKKTDAALVIAQRQKNDSVSRKKALEIENLKQEKVLLEVDIARKIASFVPIISLVQNIHSMIVDGEEIKIHDNVITYATDNAQGLEGGVTNQNQQVVKLRLAQSSLNANSQVILKIVSEHEGDFSSINTWDRAIVTFGFLQWTLGSGGDGSLVGLLGVIKHQAPQSFAERFQRYGIDVINKRFQLTRRDGRVLLGGDAARAIQPDPKLVAVLSRAGAEAAIQKIQVAHGHAVKIDGMLAKKIKGHPVRVNAVVTSHSAVGVLADLAVHKGEGGTLALIDEALDTFKRKNPNANLSQEQWQARAETAVRLALAPPGDQRGADFAHLSKERGSFASKAGSSAGTAKDDENQDEDEYWAGEKEEAEFEEEEASNDVTGERGYFEVGWQPVGHPPLAVPGRAPVPFAPTPTAGSHWPVITEVEHRKLVSYIWKADGGSSEFVGRPGRAFLAQRRTKRSGPFNRWHVGVDLFARRGDTVVACEAGKIVGFRPFYKAATGQMTFRLLIHHPGSGIIANYGEVTGDSLTRNSLEVGSEIVPGQKIAFVSDTDMIHFETYTVGKTKEECSETYRWMKAERRPPERLLNPTLYLMFLSENGAA